MFPVINFIQYKFLGKYVIVGYAKALTRSSDECYLRRSIRALSCRAPYTRAAIVKYANTSF